MNKERQKLLAVVIIIALAFFRLIPHPPNFTPILAISIFAGMKFKNNLFSYFIPVVAMLLSDTVIGFHSGVYVIYPTIVIIALMARRFKNINSAAFSSSFLFFLVTNFQVWIMSPSYPKTFLGILECYTLALPFFGMTLLSAFVFSYCLFYGFSYFSSIRIYQKI